MPDLFFAASDPADVATQTIQGLSTANLAVLVGLIATIVVAFQGRVGRAGIRMTFVLAGTVLLFASSMLSGAVWSGSSNTTNVVIVVEVATLAIMSGATILLVSELLRDPSEGSGMPNVLKTSLIVPGVVVAVMAVGILAEQVSGDNSMAAIGKAVGSARACAWTITGFLTIVAWGAFYLLLRARYGDGAKKVPGESKALEEPDAQTRREPGGVENGIQTTPNSGERQMGGTHSTIPSSGQLTVKHELGPIAGAVGAMVGIAAVIGAWRSSSKRS